MDARCRNVGRETPACPSPPRLAPRSDRTIHSSPNDWLAAALDAGATDALALLAEALEKQGRHTEVLELLAQSPDPEDSVELAIARASNSYWGGGASDAHSTRPDRDEVVATEAWLLLFDSRMTDCIDAARTVLRRDHVDDLAQVWAATACTAALGLSGRCAEALATADVGRAAAAALAPVHSWVVPQVEWATALTLVGAGRIADARDLVDAGQRTASDGSPQLVGMWSGFRGLVAKLQGDTATAIPNLRVAVRLLEEGDMYGFTRLWLSELAAAAALAGDAATARSTLEGALARRNDANRIFEPWIALDSAWVLAAEGRVSDAVDQAVAAADQARDAEQRAFEVLAAFDVARLGRPSWSTTGSQASPTWSKDHWQSCVPKHRARSPSTTCRSSSAPQRRPNAWAASLAAELATAALAHASAQSGLSAAAHLAEHVRRMRERCGEAATPLFAAVPVHFALDQPGA